MSVLTRRQAAEIYLPGGETASNTAYENSRNDAASLTNAKLTASAGSVKIKGTTYDSGTAVTAADEIIAVNAAYANGVAAEYAINSFDGTGSDIILGKHLLLHNVAIDGTFDELTRNVDPGQSNVLMGTTYRIADTAKNGSFDEPARNTADSTKYKNGEHFLLLNVDTTGSYAGGSLPVPTAPVLSGAPISVMSVALSYTGGLYVEYVRAYYKTVGGVYAQFGENFTAGPITVTLLNPRTVYTFKLTAFNSAGQADSNEVTIETLGALITGKAGIVQRFVGSAQTQNMI
jgi:hypothetical protein